MEQPSSLFGGDTHQKQPNVLHTLCPMEQLDMKDSVVLGQYFHYQEKDCVADGSMTETYAALHLSADNERWRDMPFYIHTGKKLKEREVEVVIISKRTNPDVAANVLLIRIQPTEDVYSRFNIKKPGDSDEIEATSMDLCQSRSDANRINTPETYERLSAVAIQGDASWLPQWDQIGSSWNHVEQLRQRYRRGRLPLTTYVASSTDPREADESLQRHHHTWSHADV